MRKSVGQAPTAGEQTQQKPMSDIFRHRSGTRKSYCLTTSDVGSERVSWYLCKSRFPKNIFAIYMSKGYFIIV
jgi:hypothetical protein